MPRRNKGFKETFLKEIKPGVFRKAERFIKVAEFFGAKPMRKVIKDEPYSRGI